MNENQWSAPETIDDRTNRLLAAIPDNKFTGDENSATGRLLAVLARRKNAMHQELYRLRELLDNTESDARRDEAISQVAARLCSEACAFHDIYEIGAGIGAASVREERRRASDEWYEEAWSWSRFSERAGEVAEEKRSDEAQDTLF